MQWNARKKIKNEPLHEFPAAFVRPFFFGKHRSNCATYWQLQEKIVPNCQNDTSFSSSNHTTGKGGNFQNGSKPCSCMIRSQSPFSFVPSLGSFNCSEYGNNLRWISYGKQMFLFMAQLHLFRISLNLSQKNSLLQSSCADVSNVSVGWDHINTSVRPSAGNCCAFSIQVHQ